MSDNKIDKFANVAVGDTVYGKKEISYGWGNSESFWIPCKVEKVTPKQFQVGGEKYRKSDGLKATSSYGYEGCKYIGDKDSWGWIVSDQADECRAFINRLKIWGEAKDIIKDLKLDHDNPDLMVIHEKLCQIRELINKGEI
jgi:hypothetical protein